MPDGYAVVWWEPGTGGGLGLGVGPPPGVRRHDLIVKDVPRDVVADGRTRYDQWCLSRAEARLAGGKPTLVVRSVRQWLKDTPAASDGAPVDAPIAVDIDIVDADIRTTMANRPGGAAFGTLVHAVLAEAPFDADDTVLRQLAMSHARTLAVDEDLAAAAADIAARVLRHDVLARARRAAARGACRRETPVTCLMADGTLIEGVVDLAFEDGNGWVVVDYKTDRGLGSESEESYRRQLELYVHAVAKATGRSASGVLMRI
jgi:ATP-dependent exoDNAse (exonuclease V) beta subunit